VTADGYLAAFSAAGRHVCAHWRLVGAHAGACFGLASSGRSVAVDTAEIYEFECEAGGLVCVSRAGGDPLALFLQLGADPLSGEVSER
jgi:hypothetical protein